MFRMPNDGSYIERLGVVDTANAEKDEAFQRDVESAFYPPLESVAHEIPLIEFEAFGALAMQVQKGVRVIERFIALPAIPFRFADHHEWSAWKVRMREAYGEAFANGKMKQFENNKLRVNSLSGLALAGEGLIMDFERGSDEDVRFAARIDKEWNPNGLLADIRRYRALPVSEGIKMMAYFDQRALSLLQMLHDETERREGSIQSRDFSEDAAFAAK